jgi:MFS family permease
MTAGLQRPTLLSKLQTMPAPAWVLFAGIFVNKFGNFLSIFLVLFLTSEGYSAGQAGLAVGLIGFGNILGNAIGGAMADLVGRRAAIAVSMTGSGLGTLAVPFVANLGMLCVLVTVIGIFAQIYRPAAGAILLDVVPAAQRVTAFALHRLAVNLGMAAGPVVAAYLSTRSYTVVFLVDALSSLSYAVMALLLLPKTAPKQARSRRSPSFSSVAGRPARVLHRWRRQAVAAAGFGLVLRDRGFVLFLTAMVAESYVYLQTSSVLPLHIRDASLDPRVYGWALGANAALIVAFELPLTHLIEARSSRLVLPAGILLVTTGVAVTAFTRTAPWLLVTVLIWTTGEMLFTPTAESIPGGFAVPGMRGRYQGAYGFAFSIGAMVGPTLGGVLYGLNPGYAWTGAGIVGCLAAVLVSVSVTRLRPVLAQPIIAELP